MEGIQYIQDHVIHFYHLHALDWVDIVSALEADPAGTATLAQSISPWAKSSAAYFKGIQERVTAFVQSGQLGIFDNAYWGHPAYKLPPEANLMAVAHYLEALDYQRKATKAIAIIAGKNPHIQNVVVGGVTTALNPDSANALNMERLYWIKQLTEEVRGFIQQVYLPDVAAIGALYADWLPYGKGVTNYLAVPDMVLDSKATSFDLPGGTIVDGDLSTTHAFTSFNDDRFRNGVAENISRAWYKGDWTRHPYDEDTVPDYSDFDADGRYTWLKAPRFEGRPMQVGPLAQLLVGYGLGHKETVANVNQALGLVGSVAGVKLGPEVLHSTLGRHVARAVRASMLADLTLKHWQLLVDNIGRGDLAIFEEPVFPKGEQQGFGFHEAPRGALSHWIVIQDGKIKNYQCVVPSTWNAGPRDEQDRPGPYEASLVGNPIADAKQPLEVLRTIHSFDPCIACAVHLLDPHGQETIRVKAL